MELEHEADVPIAEGHHLGIRQRADLGVADADGAAVDRVEAAHDVQERALPHSRGADDRDHLAAIERQVDAFEHRQLGAPDRVALRDAGDVDERHHWYRNACAGSSFDACRDG